MTRRGALVALIACAALVAPGEASDVGAALSDFTATTLDGERIALAEAVGSHKAVVVLFLSTACPYADYFAAHIRDLDEVYRARGVLFLGVNSNQYETVEDMREHARERGHGFPFVRDDAARIADQMGAARTPEAFLIGGDGKLRYRGWVQSKRLSPDLQRALDAVLAGKRVRLPETKAFGCAIDRPRR